MRPVGETLAAVLVGAALITAGCGGDASALPSATPAPRPPNGTPTPSLVLPAALPSSRVAPAAPPTARVTPAATPEATARPTPPPGPDPTPEPTRQPLLGSRPSGPIQEARVTKVADGDTIHVAIAGRDFRLRYIGVDTPETVKPGTAVEWMGREASAANTALVKGRSVVLEKDVSETDRYGRLLRYVWLHEGGAWTMVNLALVQRGFAQAVTYPPDVKYVDLFLDAQRRAREVSVGLWGEPPAPPTPGATSRSTPRPTPRPTPLPVRPAARGGCDPSYPGVCIPPSPPDLDCGQISFRRFEVLPPDPHRFDGNHDGIGCER